MRVRVFVCARVCCRSVNAPSEMNEPSATDLAVEAVGDRCGLCNKFLIDALVELMAFHERIGS